MTFSPHVEPSGTEVEITTGTYLHATEYRFKGKLSVHCAAVLVCELRRALRKIRDTETKRLQQAVDLAEGPLL